ncbi:hypothetical protein Tco_0606892 [Tanacetum coccineum]
MRFSHDPISLSLSLEIGSRGFRVDGDPLTSFNKSSNSLSFLHALILCIAAVVDEVEVDGLGDLLIRLSECLWRIYNLSKIRIPDLAFVLLYALRNSGFFEGDLGILDDDIGDLIYGFVGGYGVRDMNLFCFIGVEGDDGEGSFGLGIMTFLSELVIPVKILLIRNLEEIVHDFEQRLKTIFGRQVNRVHILDFEGLTPNMRQDLAERMRMVYTGDDGQEVFVSHAWRRLFGIRAPLVQEFILEFFSTCRIEDEMGLDVARTLLFQLGGVRRSMTWRQFILALGLHTAEDMAEDGFGAYWLGSERLIPDKGDLSDYSVEISSAMDFLRGAPSYTYIRYPVRRLYHRLISYNISGRGHAPEKVTATNLFYLCSIDLGAVNVPYLLAQYLFRHIEGRKSGARLLGGHFIGRLAHHFGLVSDDGLRGLSVMARELPLIDMGELVKLYICMEFRYDWAWVAPRPERQQVAAAGAPKAAEYAPAVDEGTQADPAPVQAPQPPPPPPAAGRTMPQRLERLEEEIQGPRRDVRSLRGLASGQTYQAFDGTFRGSSPAIFERCTRQRTGKASTSAAPQQPNP